MPRLLPVFLAALVVGAGIAYWGSTQSRAPGPDLIAQSSDASGAETEGSDGNEIAEMAIGAEDAPVTVIEYASFTCPHCATFHGEQFKKLKSDYVDTGKVRFIFREVYFDRFGLWASIIARCGGQERYFGMIDLIFKTQSEWSRAGDPVTIANELRKIGRVSGLGDDTIEACLKDEDKARAMIAWYQANAEEHGIDSTPSLVIDGETFSNMSYASLADIIDEKLGGQ